MGKVCVTEDYLQDIADAIREKGVEGTFTPAQMGDAVRQISGGGGVAIINRLFNGCESQYTSDSSSTPQLLDSYTDGADFSSYISTNDHKTFTVLQDFIGMVTVGIMQDKDRSSGNKPNCTFFLNNNEYYSLDAQNATSGSASKTKDIVMVEFETGDTFFWGSNNGSGWPVRLGALDLIDSVDMSGYVDPDWT
jgi:hypothetical protein